MQKSCLEVRPDPSLEKNGICLKRKNKRVKMKIGFASVVVVMFSVSLLSGCAMQKMDAQKPLSTTDAIASFAKLGYGEWVESPFVRTEAVCGAEKVPVQFSEIKHAKFSLRQSKLQLLTSRKGICSASYVFLLKDVEDANRLVTAANSLGASVEYLITSDN